VARSAADLRVVLLGSFRTDEAPRLRESIQAAHLLRLGRLDADAIVRLGRMMIGEAGAQPEVTALLIRESEGIPLFVVEIVRMLAESAGTLDAIGAGILRWSRAACAGHCGDGWNTCRRPRWAPCRARR
jgi:hypothetical protein